VHTCRTAVDVEKRFHKVQGKNRRPQGWGGESQLAKRLPNGFELIQTILLNRDACAVVLHPQTSNLRSQVSYLPCGMREYIDLACPVSQIHVLGSFTLECGFTYHRNGMTIVLFIKRPDMKGGRTISPEA